MLNHKSSLSLFCVILFFNMFIVEQSLAFHDLSKEWKKEIAHLNNAFKHSSDQKIEEAKKVIRLIIRTFPEEPLMLKIAFCESSLVHKENGELKRNRQGSSAVGALQILSSVHKQDLKKQGLNLNKTEDYFQFARFLFENRGVQPWQASKKCWNQHKIAYKK